MKSRCCNRNHRSYKNYGGREIKICERWMTFENFVADMGPRKRGTTLDRRDNDGDYEPSNCRWASRAIQDANKRTNVKLTINGRTLCVTEWSEESGTNKRTIFGRLRRGMSHEESVMTPAKKVGRGAKRMNGD